MNHRKNYSVQSSSFNQHFFLEREKSQNHTHKWPNLEHNYHKAKGFALFYIAKFFSEESRKNYLQDFGELRKAVI